MSIKPIQTEEAVADCNRINDTLLQVFDYDGNYRRAVEKDCDQTWYSFTRNPKEGEPRKTIPNSHPFMQYLDSVKDGSLSAKMLYKYTRTYDPKKKPELSLMDKVTIKYNGKSIETTLGRYIFNKIVFYTVWDNKSDRKSVV